MLIAEMRFGKTFVALELARLRQAKEVLITCPKATVPMWEKLLKEFGLDGAAYPYSILSRRQLKSKRRFSFLIIDEIHMLRSYSGRMRTCEALAKCCDYRLGLTGTPLNKSELELYYPLRILTAGKGSIPTRRDEWHEQWGVDISSPRSDFSDWVLDPAKEKLFYESLALTTHSAYNTRVVRPNVELLDYPLTPAQEEAIEDLKSTAYQIGAVTFTQAPQLQGPAHLNRKIEQVQSGFLFGDEEEPAVFACYKYDVLEENVERELKQGHLVLIWYRYIYEKDKVKALFGEKVSLWNKAGDQDNLTKDKPILLCHTRSAGSGIEIGHADVSYYLGIFDDFINLKQSNYRLVDQHGVKEKRNIFMVCDSAVDKLRYRQFSEKEDLYNKGYDALT